MPSSQIRSRRGPGAPVPPRSRGVARGAVATPDTDSSLRHGQAADRLCDHRRVVARIGLIVAALVVAGCLAFTLRATNLEADARALLTGPPDRLPAATVDHADRILRDAQRHNPDIRPEAGRGLLLASAGRVR